MQKRKEWQTYSSQEVQAPVPEEKSYRYIFLWSAVYVVLVISLFIGVVIFVTGL